MLPLLATLAPSLLAVPFDDTCATAVSLGSLPTGSVIFFPRELSPLDTTDHYRVQVGPGVRAELMALFSHSEADIQLRLWSADCSTLLATSTTSTDDESIDWLNAGGAPVDLVLEVYVDQAPGQVVPYRVRSGGTQGTCDFDDLYEPNNACLSASPLPASAFIVQGLSIVPSDEDWYEFVVPPTSQLLLEVFSSLSEGDTNIEVWRAGCQSLLSVVSDPGIDSFTYMNATDLPEPLLLCVLRNDFAPTCASYAIRRTVTVGVNECGSSANSSGQFATLRAFGSNSLASQSLTLSVVGAPANQFGLYLYGPTAATVPVGASTLCVDPQGLIRGRVEQGQFAGLSFSIPYADPAPGASPIAAGDTFRFQAWFRDPGSVDGFGMTDAMRVTFVP